MAPKVRAEKVHEDYLETLATGKTFRLGFLLGIAENTCGFEGIVVHMAPLPFNEDDEKHPASLDDVDTEEIVLHAINLTRMLPGCFTVMGLFVVSPVNVFEDEGQRKKLVDIVNKVQEQFRQNPFLMATQGDEKNFLVLGYTTGKPCVCQQILKGKVVDVDFCAKGLTWRTLEPNLIVEENFELEKIGDTCSIEGSVQKILGKISQQLEEAYIVRPGQKGQELGKVQEDDLVDMLFSQDDDIQTTSLKFFMKDKDDVEDAKVTDGTVQISGKICCFVSVPSQTKLSVVETYIRKDFIRSLAGRLQLYCDTLAEGKIKMENLIDLHNDTPRRIFFTVQPTGVQFSDYLFPGENDDTVRENVKKLMGIDLDPTDIYLWVEDGDDMDPQQEDDFENSTEANRDYGRDSFKYIAVSSVIVILFSIYIMFFWYSPQGDYY
uniref:Putative olfactory receptor 4-like protein n=1 Tax=Nyssomyia neivai TaxID=330878 RepID=A0A1L8DJK3_9DIPT